MVSAASGRAVTDAPELPVRPEPLVLKNSLRRLAATRPSAALGESLGRLSRSWWRSSRPSLEPLGVTAAALERALRGAEREVWLWVMGDRSWTQLEEHLRGRLSRRLGR